MATDLAVLYKDEALSADSRCAVERHLSECADCRKYYRSISNERIPANDYPSMDDEEYVRRFDSLKTRLKKRRERAMAVMSAVTFIAIGMIIAGAIVSAKKMLRD
jgi:predicted anti-sigma-YlaC factor YlaD